MPYLIIMALETNQLCAQASCLARESTVPTPNGQSFSKLRGPVHRSAHQPRRVLLEKRENAFQSDVR